MKFHTVLLSLLIAMVPRLLAQTSFSVETESGYTSNAYANYLSQPDYYTGLSAQIQHDHLRETSGLRFFYNGDYSAFRQFHERNNFQHHFGAAFYKDLREAGDRLQAGAGVQQRWYGETYQWYEYNQLYAYLNGKIIMLEQLYGYWGGQLRYRTYNNLDAFSNLQSSLYLRTSLFLPTRTSFIAEMNYLTKSYSAISNANLDPAMPEVLNIGSGISQQVVTSLRVAQSLFRKTGLSVEYLVRRNPNSAVRYLGTLEGFYFSDEELFDDVFGYQSEELSATLKQILPFKMHLQFGAMLSWKNYDNRLATQLDGVPFEDTRLRQDTQKAIWVQWEKSLKIAENWQPITLRLSWTNWRNESNDPYYNYRMTYLSFGLEQGF